MGFWRATQQVRHWSREIITSEDWNERQAAGVMQAAISDFNCKDSQFNMGSEDAGCSRRTDSFQYRQTRLVHSSGCSPLGV